MWPIRVLTAPARALPQVVIIGAPRAGTTSLFDYLIQHAQLVAGWKKEVHYFDLHYGRGERWYRAHFPLRHTLDVGGRRVLEATPYLLSYPLAPRRVHDLLPEARLIALLRNPVERAYSHWAHACRHGWEDLPFDRAVRAEPGRIGDDEERLVRGEIDRSDAYARLAYVRRSEYAPQVQRWLAVFPRDQLLVLQSERLFAEPARTMDRVFTWLALSQVESAYPARNQLPRIPLDRDLADELSKHFAGPNEDLFDLLGERFDW